MTNVIHRSWLVHKARVSKSSLESHKVALNFLLVLAITHKQTFCGVRWLWSACVQLRPIVLDANKELTRFNRVFAKKYASAPTKKTFSYDKVSEP